MDKNSVPMKNKTWTCLVVVSAALLMAGCGSRTKKQTNEDVSMDSVGVTCSGVKTLQLEGVQATWIQDNAGEHLMPRTIFPDASDELMESLSLQGGIPSSMSTFLVDTNGIRILLIREWELPAVVCCPDYNLWVSLRQILISVSYPFPWRPYRWNDEGRQCSLPECRSVRIKSGI